MVLSKKYLKNSHLAEWPALPINRSEPNPNGDMGWGWASYGSYPKVMVRSSQFHSKVKSAPHGRQYLMLVVLLQLRSLVMSMMA